MGAASRGDVIVAPATPPGHSALGVVRLSGPGLIGVLGGFVRPMGRPGPSSFGGFTPGRPRRVILFDGEGVFDEGVAVVFVGERTPTGEPLAELTAHGNPLIIERVVAAAVGCGARVADPGEFTRRALLAGKVDLIAAEGVLHAATATSPRGLALARQALGGELGAYVRGQGQILREVAAELEARLDWPADELAHEDDEALVARLEAVARGCRALAGTYELGRIAVQGARIALVGPVNAGKSSLFNGLLGRTRALVHETPGTTRDVLEAPCRIGGGLMAVVLDTAGERETADPVEAAGLALARELTDEVDLLVVVLRDRSDGISGIEREILGRTRGRPGIVVVNGIDAPLAAGTGGAGILDAELLGGRPVVRISAKTGEGLDLLGKTLGQTLLNQAPSESELVVASARQRDLLGQLAQACDEAIEALPLGGPAVAAECVVEALEACDGLTGEDTRERVLDEVFARFCIGK